MSVFLLFASDSFFFKSSNSFSFSPIVIASSSFSDSASDNCFFNSSKSFFKSSLFNSNSLNCFFSSFKASSFSLFNFFSSNTRTAYSRHFELLSLNSFSIRDNSEFIEDDVLSKSLSLFFKPSTSLSTTLNFFFNSATSLSFSPLNIASFSFSFFRSSTA